MCSRQIDPEGLQAAHGGRPIRSWPPIAPNPDKPPYVQERGAAMAAGWMPRAAGMQAPSMPLLRSTPAQTMACSDIYLMTRVSSSFSDRLDLKCPSSSVEVVSCALAFKALFNQIEPQPPHPPAPNSPFLPLGSEVTDTGTHDFVPAAFCSLSTPQSSPSRFS